MFFGSLADALSGHGLHEAVEAGRVLDDDHGGERSGACRRRAIERHVAVRGGDGFYDRWHSFCRA